VVSLPIQYPQFFSHKLQTNSKIRAAVDSSIAVVSDLLQVSKLPFFPDYTDHGFQHLTTVLEIADKLIANGTRELVTAEDTAVLIVSVLSHDLALHISEAGFKSLIDAATEPRNAHSDRWKALWLEFLGTARHWDDRQLVQLFGADETGSPQALVRDPFDHFDNLTEGDRKLIGEFIRKNHADLAYQFAVFGFPGRDGQFIEFGSLDPDLRRLAAIVARSHGFPMRDSVSLLEREQFNKLEHNNVHPVFLIGVLRVADFLDLGSDRAPVIALTYKDLKSPISQREWKTNQAFRKISWGNPDPESIHIPANPTDVYSYLELTKWLASIQAELDMTWAVIGEVYGGHPRFSQFALAIRRVRSNVIDNPTKFAESAQFVPKRFELGVAGADVLKLFIGPLYGDSPEIGIRELIQNSIDAVRERWEYEKRYPSLPTSRTVEADGDVVVWLDDPDDSGNALLTILDRGIGMTEEVIADYFLKAGASFRRSIAWKKEFELESGLNAKKQIKSRVLRSGRFGIGVLSAFLLGNEIEVSTRHVRSDRGIRFSLQLDLSPPAVENKPIELIYDNGLPVGTCIKLKVNKIRVKDGRSGLYAEPDIFSYPSLWDWYCLEAPVVARFLGRQRKHLEQSTIVPLENSVLPSGWHLLSSSDYRAVHMLAGSGFRQSHIICNGIEVRVGHEGFMEAASPTMLRFSRDLFPSEGLFRLRTPQFSIFDPDGNLPLNLQRTGLTNTNLDFLDDAYAVQAEAAFTKLVLKAPTERMISPDFMRVLKDFFGFSQVIPIFFTRTGTGLLTKTSLRAAGVRNCLLVPQELLKSDELVGIMDKYDAVLVAQWGQRSSPVYALNDLDTWIASARVVTKSNEAPGVKRRFRYKERSFNGVQVFRTANCSPSLITDSDVSELGTRFFSPRAADQHTTSDDFLAAELFLKTEVLAVEELKSSVGRRWEQIFPQPTISFNRDTREVELGQACRSMRAYSSASSEVVVKSDD
jgi:molecular chaperone HtpG